MIGTRRVGGPLVNCDWIMNCIQLYCTVCNTDCTRFLENHLFSKGHVNRKDAEPERSMCIFAQFRSLKLLSSHRVQPGFTLSWMPSSSTNAIPELHTLSWTLNLGFAMLISSAAVQKTGSCGKCKLSCLLDEVLWGKNNISKEL